MEKVSNKILLIIRSCVVGFLFFYSVYFQYIPVILFHIDLGSLAGNTKVAVLFSMFSDLILLFILLLIYRKEIINEVKIFFKNWKDNIDTGFSCWITGLLIMFLSNMVLVNFFHSAGANNEEVVREMIHSFPLVMGLEACCVAPIIEELVFRKAIRDIFPKPAFFIPLSFFAFGLAHVAGMATSIVDWLYIIPYGALGGVFAYAYHKTDTFCTSCLFHALHNTIVFLLTITIL